MITHQPKGSIAFNNQAALSQTNCVPVHWASSDQSPQSFSPSHFHHVGIQRPFLHSYWKYLEQPGTSVGAAATHRAKVYITYCCSNITALPQFSEKSGEQK